MRRAADEQVTCEFQGNDAAAGRFYENRAFPTPDGGVAVYFRDVTERREHERLIELARAYAESIVTTVREPLLVLDKDLRVVSANRSFYATFKVEPAETEGRARLRPRGWAVGHPRVEDAPRGDRPGEPLVRRLRGGARLRADRSEDHAPERSPIPSGGALRIAPPGHRGHHGPQAGRRESAPERGPARRGPATRPHRQLELGPDERRLRLVGRALPHLRVRAADPPITLDRAWDRVHPEDRSRVRDLFDRAMRDRRPYDCIFRLVLDDGAVRIVQSRGRPAVDEGGELVRMFGTIQDVTERMQTEEALRESEARFAGRSRTRPSASGTWTAPAATSASTGASARSWGTAARAAGGHLLQLTHPDDMKLGVDQFDALDARRAVKLLVGEALPAKDGAPVWVNTSISLQRDAAGNPRTRSRRSRTSPTASSAEEALRRRQRTSSTWPCAGRTSASGT